MQRLMTQWQTALRPARGLAAQRKVRGFTMIELVVVMAVLGLLLSLAMPRYMASLDRGREQVLQNNLAQMREAIDRFYGDNARYPERLEELVTKRYLRAVPLNPYTEAPDWNVVAPPGTAKGAVFDVRDPTAPSAGPDMAAAPMEAKL
jgi:general secretion pathway protein G